MDPNLRTPSTNELPFVAPCRVLDTQAPTRWIKAAWSDLKAHPKASLWFGLMICLLSHLVTLATWRFGNLGLYLGLVTGFVFVAPALAMTFYVISKNHQATVPVHVLGVLKVALTSWRRSLVLAVLLIIVSLIWARAANTLYVFYPLQHEPSWSDLAWFLSVGTIVGALFSLVVFAMSAFSLPMLLDRKVDAVTAVITSINAVLRNKVPMLLWAMIIVATVISGIVTAWLSFVVVMPLIGHATWHAYRATIDSSDWPEA